MEDYFKYRGKCKEFCQDLINKNPELKLVRGYYYEPFWNRKEPHWWCVDTEGNIIDPTSKQFPSGGIDSFYEEFNGMVECSECGKSCKEDEMKHHSRYSVCSTKCYGKLVGVEVGSVH